MKNEKNKYCCKEFGMCIEEELISVWDNMKNSEPYKREGVIYQILNGFYVANLKYCPFCSEKLPL